MSSASMRIALAIACALCAAGAAHAAASGRTWERAALQWRAQGRFDSAAYGFQQAADAFAAEGDSDANVRALRETADAQEKYADHLLAGGQAVGAPAAGTAGAQAAPQPQRLAAVNAPAAGALPQGRYACDFQNGGAPGYVDIRGGGYRGPDLEPSGGYSAYAMAGDAITWSAGFGEFTVVSSQFRGADTSGNPWFTVTYSRTHGGGIDSVDCIRE